MHVCFQCSYLQQYIPILQKNKNILREYEKQLHISEDCFSLQDNLSHSFP